MKLFKKFLLCFVLVILFGANVLNVKALSNNELENINYEFSDYYDFMGAIFNEGEMFDYNSLITYSCWSLLYTDYDNYIVGYEDEEYKIGPKYKVPAEKFEEYILSKFAVNSDYLVGFRDAFNDISLFTKDADYITENGKNYYQFTLDMGGVGAFDFSRVLGVNELGNDYYQVYYYSAVFLEDAEIMTGEKYVIDENSVLGRDYIIAKDYNGEEKQCVILQFYSSKILYKDGNIKFISNNIIDKSEVPADKDLILYVPSEYEEDGLPILDGANQEFNVDGDSLLTFRIDGDFDLFEGVYIDDDLVDPKNYTAKSGSTIIIFNNDYTKKLKTGEHTLVATYSDGTYATTSFTLSVNNPATLGGYAEMIILAFILLGSLYIISCKFKKIPR